ncbi:uncharacterized protein EV154DRAFT_604652 [Mucor mucedo]|uniref:Uncharacterized protein n=1 Tax=Mucor saturninus TaxID=64648 RepID=A0A8H7RBY1_9FUNG|nr:uncharacterized protein EV154DRAFT_604652 [Mucor mucedo]KAG2206806.1 hypothetical protein INT47_007562 [Mucor saturninus]KAI7888711.1 hypothetical protein EV154DRAFT_604652 [Mucor mucedo]
MFSSKLTQMALAVGVGIGTGVYIFKPLLQEYEQETHGTWVRPGDEVKLQKNTTPTETRPSS